MTLPNPRKVVVEGKEYPYLLKGGKGRLFGDSGATLQLTVQIGKNRYAQGLFLSKQWTAEHAENLDMAPTHKVAFKPSDVVAVVRGLEDGKIPEGFELPEWRLV